jgi:hypothetical protein
LLQGAWTAEAARALSNEFDAQGFDVFCAHRDKRARKRGASPFKTGRIISWVGSDLTAWSQLAFPDIAVVDRNTKKVILLSEVEENKAQPKLVIGDILANLLGDYLTFAPDPKEKMLVGSWTTFSFLAKSTGKGSGEQQLRMLQHKLNQTKKNLSTPNAAVKEIIIDTYQSEPELQEKLVNQTKTALKEFEEL